MRRAVVAAVWAAALSPFLAAPPADAHGKEIRLEATCRAEDPATPLVQLCEARAVFASDGEPASDVRLELSARRLGRPAPPVAGVPLQSSSDAGLYAVTVTLPTYGNWEFTLTAASPTEGRIVLTEQVLPPSVAASGPAEGRARLIIRFGPRDVGNIVVLGLHMLGTVALLAASAAVLIGALPNRIRVHASYRRVVAQRFPLAAAASMLLLALSGAYNAAYNAPTRAPGLFHPDTIARLPYGRAYVIAFALKMVLAAVLFVNTIRLAVLLRRGRAWSAEPGPGGGPVAGAIAEPHGSTATRGPRDPCLIPALINVVAGGAVLAIVLVIGYLHLLAHAGVLTA